MHIPDGILSTPVWASLQALALPAVGWMARKAKADVDESRLPLLGVMGAFVFAAQMVNFPVVVGTSGHLLGGALLATTLGPTTAALAMTAILVVQALIFQDGGILALGANILNMAILGVFAGYLPYHFWGAGPWRRAAVFLGGLLSVITGACLALVELTLSLPALPLGAVGVSVGIFLALGVIEGGITLAVFEAIERLNPRWVRSPAGQARVWGLLASAALVAGLAGVVFASAAPDVLETLMEQAGVAGQASALFPAPFGDYEWQAVANPWLRKAAAGLFGLALIYLVCVVSARLLRRRATAA